ncbi:MAG: cadherin repeat domain-containing protein [Candidatus Woesearchaeota archaeon]
MRIIFVIFILFIFTLLIKSSSALNVEYSIITTTNATTLTDIICTFNITGEGNLFVNYTWFNGSAIFFSNTQTVTSGVESTAILSNLYTRKNEYWTCGVIGSNYTHNTTQMNSSSIQIQNSPPVITFPTLKQNALEDVVFGPITAIAIDYDDDLIIGWFARDRNSTPHGGTVYSTPLFSMTTSTITFNASYAQIGNHTMRIYAEDTDGAGSKEVIFEVLAVNDAPYFDPVLGPQTATEGVPYSLIITGVDEESNYPLNFSINSSLDYLKITSISSTSANITFNRPGNAPVYTERGNYTIMVNITDFLNASALYFFGLIIYPVNHIPNITSVNNTNGTQNQSFLMEINASDIDEGQILNFSVNSLNCSLSNPWVIQTINNGTWNGTHVNAVGIINISNLTNNHVVCSNIIITVTDNASGGGASYSINLSLNLTNTNDPPIIYEMSFYSQNLRSGNNMSNLSGAKGVTFTYKVNATDPDLLVYNSGDWIIYSINESTKFMINDTTGIITNVSAMTDSYIGNYSYNITVTDSFGLNASRIVNIYIINNTAPIINVSGNLTCSQGLECLININVTDPEGGPYIWSFISNTEFSSNIYKIYNVSDNKLLNFTPTNSQVGNHSINISIIDPLGASDLYILNFTVLNVNDAPFFDMNRNNISDSITFPIIVVEHISSLQINVTDYDLDLENVGVFENLTFSCLNTSNGVNCTDYSFFTMTKNTNYSILVGFNPTDLDIGNYSFNFSVTDLSNATESQIVNFSVYDRTNPPNINLISPYGLPISNFTIFELINTSNFSGARSTTINISENSTVKFSHFTTDENVDTLTYAWYYQNNLNATTMNLSYYFDFFSSGLKNITLFVFDETYMNASWEWLVNVSNVNRGPYLKNLLENITGVNQSTLIIGYFDCGNGIQRFIDDDDDLNSNGVICSDLGETNNLSYSMNGTCEYADISISGQDLIINPTNTGLCYVSFIATDNGGLTYDSNLVQINISKTAENVTQPLPIVTSGGGSSRQIVSVPTPEEVDVPKVVELIIPDVVVIYKDRTIKIPVQIKNNWSEDIKEVRLAAHTNASNVSLQFDQDYFDIIRFKETKKVTLTVKNYRLGENFEIKIDANVTTPLFSDSASVLINSLEREDIGQQVQTKVTFARDLLESNPECLELNEILERAQGYIVKGAYENALVDVNSVIEGCKYLISQRDQKKPDEQAPFNWFQKIVRNTNKFLLYILLFFILILFIVAPLVILKVRKIRNQSTKKENN